MPPCFTAYKCKQADLALIQNNGARVPDHQKEKYLMQFESVKRWLNGLRNQTTKRNYVYALFLYCRETQLSPNQLIEEKAKSVDNINLRGLPEDRLKLWHRKKEQTAPGRAILTFKAVKSFFKANYLPLSAKIPAYVQQREEIYIPKKAEVEAMCELANLETATFTLFAAESGQRDGTIADLTLAHVQECLNGEPYSFIIPQKRNPKTGKIVKSKRIYGGYGFVCEDAVKKLKLLLKTKPHLKMDDKIFSREAMTYSKTITKIAVKLGINKKGKGLKRFRLHNLRKRAQTIMEDCGIPLNWVDRILGHKPRGSQADAYSLPSKEKLAAKYSAAVEALQIYETRSTSQPKIEGLERRISQLETIVAKLA